MNPQSAPPRARSAPFPSIQGVVVNPPVLTESGLDDSDKKARSTELGDGLWSALRAAAAGDQLEQLMDSTVVPAETLVMDRDVVQVSVDFESGSNFFSGFSDRLDDGGLFFATYTGYQIGATLELRVSVPDGEFVATGVVRWIRAAEVVGAQQWPGVGLELVEVDDEGRALAHAFMARRTPLFHIE